MFLTLESLDEIIWCDHTNDTLPAVFSHGTIYIKILYKMKFGTCLEFSFWALSGSALLGVKGVKGNLFLLSLNLGAAKVQTSDHPGN